MKAGTPVVTSSSTAMPEVAGDAAVIVDPYDVSQMVSAISQLLRDISLREELIKKGKARARDYSGRHRGAKAQRHKEK